jgi:hypothetical protein
MEDDFFDRPKALKTTTKKSFPNVVTNEILDRLEQVESGGKADAVNKESGAEGAYQFLPSTTKMLLAKGIKFDPKNRNEARSAARTYLQQLVDQNEGDVEKALAQYGGFKKQDSTNYVNMVLGRQPIGGTKQEYDFFDRPIAPKTKTIETPTGTAVVEEKVPPTPEEKIANQAAFGIYPRMAGRRDVIEARKPPSTEGMGGSLAAIGDVIAGAPSALLGLAGYGGLRAFGRTPEQAAETAYGTAGLISQPIGKLTGTAGTPAYEKDVLTAPLRQLGQYTQSKAKEISQAFGISEQDAEFAINAGLLAAPKVAKTVVPPIARAVTGAGEVVQDVRGQMAQQLAAKQAQPQVTPQVNPQFQSGGAAAVAHTNAVRSALSEARPDLQATFANKNPLEVTPQDLKAIEIHNKFAKVDKDFVPTEAQALQDVAKLSDEYNLNSKPGYEDLRRKFTERDPFLIKGFNNVKEEFAPSHSGVGQQGKANNILEDVKVNRVDVDNQNIKNAYTKLEEANNGKFPLDAKKVSEIALEKLNASDDIDFLPDTWKKRLSDYATGEKDLNLNKFENLRTQLATARRAEKDGNVRNAIGHIQDALEELPLTDETAIQFKGLADNARNLFRAQKEILDPKKPTYNKLYQMAYEDNRTPTEVMMGNVPHPAANGFFENFIAGNKTTPADLSRAIELVGKDSPAHQEIIAGLADHLKQKSGVIDDKGNVSQAALNKELNKLGPRLDLVAGSEVANRLRNIGDVASLSEHVRNKAGGSANVSQTTKTSEREAAKEVLGGLAETGLSLATGGKSGIVAATLKPMFKARQERLATEAAQKAQQESVNRMVSPTAGISTTPRIELNNMLPNRP